MKTIAIVFGMVLILAAGGAYAMDGHHGQSTGDCASCGTADCNGMSGNHQGHAMGQHHTQLGHDMNQNSGNNAPSAHQHAGQGGTNPETDSRK
jgi:hypothetical protein